MNEKFQSHFIDMKTTMLKSSRKVVFANVVSLTVVEILGYLDNSGK